MLLPSVSHAGQHFGLAVAVQGDTAVVGAPATSSLSPCPGIPDCAPGAAFVFRFDGSAWVEEAILVPSDAAHGQGFGGAVAIDGDRIVVGAPGDDGGGAPGDLAGAVYVFARVGNVWLEQAKLVAAVPSPFALFGVAVVIDGDRVITGTSGVGASVHHFGGAAWTHEALLVAAGIDWTFGFGADAAIIGTQGVEGPLHVASTFRRVAGAWQEEQELTGGGHFGTAVDIEGDLIAVGAWGDSEIHFAGGAVDTFRFDGTAWQREREFIAPAPDTWLGRAVAVSGDEVIAGAPHGEPAGPAGGSITSGTAGNTARPTPPPPGQSTRAASLRGGGNPMTCSPTLSSRKEPPRGST